MQLHEVWTGKRRLVRERWALQIIADFVGWVGKSIMEADKSFKKRQRLIDKLDLTARLAIEDGEKVAYVSCLTGDGRAPIAAISSSIS